MNAFESPHLPGEVWLPRSLDSKVTYPIAGELCPESDIRRLFAIIPVSPLTILVDLPAYIFSPITIFNFFTIPPHSHYIKSIRPAKPVYGFGNGAVA